MDQATQQQIPPEIRGYLENLLIEANVMPLDAQMKEGMIKELFNRLDSYLTSIIVNQLKPEDLESFIKLNEEKKPQAEIEVFLKEKIPNVQEVFTKAFADFKNLYLGHQPKDNAA